MTKLLSWWQGGGLLILIFISYITGIFQVYRLEEDGLPANNSATYSQKVVFVFKKPCDRLGAFLKVFPTVAKKPYTFTITFTHHRLRA